MIRHTTLVITLAFLLSSCTGESGSVSSSGVSEENWAVSMQCQSISANEEMPLFALYATVDEYKIKLAEINGCDSIGSESYADYQIPGDALAAAGGWWAGAGDYFYAHRNGNTIEFWHAQLDEQLAGTGIRYELVATYDHGKFAFIRQGEQ